jgi:F-type H+-transporting ATPase subunit alpha
VWRVVVLVWICGLGLVETVVVYGMIGKSVGGVKNAIKVLQEKDGLKNTVVVAGFSTDPLPLIFLAAKTAVTVAEYFREMGKDVLLILDDMGSHAKAYREISLLANKFPGREAYPGNIFHEHAAILERAGKFNESAGGGSITAIPVIELDLDDFSSYIPTNLMAMTDGHLLFKSNIYAQGRRPAVDVAMSVSRVGRQTQNSLQNSLAAKIKQTLAAAAQLSSVTGFGGELPLSTQLLLRQQEMIQELLSQPAQEKIELSEQLILLSLPYVKFFADRDINFVIGNRVKILKAIQTDSQIVKLMRMIGEIRNASDLIVKLDEMGSKFAEIVGEHVSHEQIVDEQTWLPNI